MRKKNAFLLIEILISLGVFAACALSIAFSSTAIRVNYLKALHRRRVLIVARNALEQSQNIYDIFPITSSALTIFLRTRGAGNSEPFFCKRTEVFGGKDKQSFTLVGIA